MGWGYSSEVEHLFNMPEVSKKKKRNLSNNTVDVEERGFQKEKDLTVYLQVQYMSEKQDGALLLDTPSVLDWMRKLYYPMEQIHELWGKEYYKLEAQKVREWMKKRLGL